MLNLDTTKKNQSPIMQPLPSFQVSYSRGVNAVASKKNNNNKGNGSKNKNKNNSNHMKSSVPVDIQRFLIVFFVVVVWAKKYCALLIVFVVRESHVDKPNTNTHTHVQHKQTSIYVYIVTYSKAVFKHCKPSPKTAATHFTFSKRGTAQRQLRKTQNAQKQLTSLSARPQQQHQRATIAALI